jgi:hypothetical protein
MALKSSKEFLQSALINNTFDLETLDKGLRMTLENSFSYLYRLQRNTVIYEEFHYTTRNVVGQPDYGDLYLDKRGRVSVNIPVELILPNGREKYRLSNYYKKEITLQEIAGNHTIFAKIPVIILDNKMVKDFTVRIYDDYFTVILPFKREFLYDKKFVNEEWNYQYLDHEISVQIINNTFFTDISTNASMLKRNSYDGKSYDRILSSYLSAVGVTIPTNYVGLLFASVFIGNQTYFGSIPQDVELDENGDYRMYFDKATRDALDKCNGPVTIRFIFYRYLYKKESFHFDGENLQTQLIQVRQKNDAPASEIFTIADKNEKPYGMPVPTENLIVYRSIKNEEDEIETFKQIPNSSVTINYPNIYRINSNVSEGDFLRVYYFYIPPYDLSYKNMYQFYYNYLKYKWEDMKLDAILNQIYFGDIDWDGDPMLREITVARTVTEKFTDPEGCRLGLFYEWSLDPEDRGKSPEELEKEYYKTQSDKIDAETMTEEEIEEWLKEQMPIRIQQFLEVFDYITNLPIVERVCDEVDYTKGYMHSISPLEYRTRKMKELVQDDPMGINNSLRAIQQVVNKYTIVTSKEELDTKRYTEVMLGSGNALPEPCYAFSITKVNPNSVLTARIFTDGLFCSNFIYERYEFSDYIYVPVDTVPDDVKTFDIEVFPTLVQEEVVTFTSENPSVIIDFESTDEIRPTLSDLYFYYGTLETLDRIPLNDFRLEVVSEQCEYYDTDGNVYNTIEIKRDENYVNYDSVAYGSSIINKENDGVTFTILRKLKITAINVDLFDKEITVAIAKHPHYFVTTAQSVIYPKFEIKAENIEPIAEYTRVFRDGRLRSRNCYDFRPVNGKLMITTLVKLPKRSTLAIDITPYRNRLVYFNAEISTDTVDLRGYIDKPFDLTYYDVYLNGRKLNKTNVFPISPWSFKLAGVHSCYNLEVYERDMDWEYFDASDDLFTIDDLLKKRFMEKSLKDKIIHDLTGDVSENDNTEERQQWSRENDMYTIILEMFYYERLVALGVGNPDELQFDENDIKENYDLVDQIFRVQNDNGEDLYLLNPDVYYKPENLSDDKERWRVYLTGNSSPDEFNED